jgi:uncharacterized repeat protein (TIGR01451 family)
MKDKTCTPPHLTQNRWFRLGFSIALAFLLALVLLFIPLTAGTIRIPAPSLLQPEPVPFGVALVRAAGNLTVTKSAPLTVTSGGVLTYTLTVTNGTGRTLEFDDNVAVFEYLPNGAVDCLTTQPPSGWTVGCSPGTDPTIWGLYGSFADGSSIIFTYTVRISSSLPNQFKIVNDNYGGAVGSDPPSQGPPFTTTVYAPTWEISKTVSSDIIQPGGYLTYTITITNNGPVATSGTYTITDQLPNDTHYVTGSASPAATFDDPNLRWVLSDPVEPGQSVAASFVVTVTTPLTGGTSIVNQTYNVSGGNVYTPTTAGDPITVTVESEAVLEISKVASADPATVGQVLTYTITVTNVGSIGPAQGVVITDTLPGELLYQSAGFVGGSTGAITDTGGNPIIWTLNDMIAPDTSAQVTLTVQVTNVLPTPPLITNTFEASADNAPLVSDSMAVNVQADVPEEGTITVAVGSTNLQICETTRVTATFKDKFGNPIPGETINLVPLPPGDATFTPPSGSTNADGILTSTLTAITGPLRVWAYWGDFDRNGFSDLINVTEPSLPSNLSLSVSPDPLFAGGATAVVTGTLTDCRIPAQSVSGQPITFTLSDLGLATFPGPSDSANGNTDANGILTATLTSTSTETANGTLTITGTSEGAGWSLQDTVTLAIQPAPAPVLTITKTANPADGNTLNPESTINYTIRVTNTGNADATDVLLTDTLPLSVSYVSLISSTNGSGSISGPSRNGNIVALSLSKLEPAKTLVATIEVTVTATVSGTNLSNFANAKSSATNLVTSNIVVHTVVTTTASPGNKVYLPIILKQ